MAVIGLETSEYASSLALVSGGHVLASQSFPSRMELCLTLTRRLGELLQGQDAGICGLSGLAVSLGPGSFTGLRVGVATAKALAHACGRPLVGVCTQEAIAAAAEEPAGTVMCVVQQARQGHVYSGLWEKTHTGARPCSAIRVIAADALACFLGHSTSVIIGPAAEMILEASPELAQTRRIRTALPSAAVVARLGEERLAEAEVEAAYTLQPIYVLASQAERARKLTVTGATGPGPWQPRSLVIRRGELDDLPRITEIENASFASPWPEVSLRDELVRRTGALFLVAEVDGIVAGYAISWTYAGEAHVCNVAVSPDFRRCGLAEILMLAMGSAAISAECDIMLLEYRVSNLPAAALYEKLGFRKVGRRKGYYQDNNEDAVVASVADLTAPERQEALVSLRQRWEERYQYDLTVDL